MASGDILAVFTPLHNEPPASNPATIDERNNIPCLDFDATTDEEAVFGGFMPDHYAGGGINVELIWGATTATSGNVVWQVAIERWQDDANDVDADSFAAPNNGGQDLAPSASGEMSYDSITFTDGADMDSLAAGEAFRIKIRRDADDTDATDDMTGDAELYRIVITES